MAVLLRGVGDTRKMAASQEPRLVEHLPRATEEQPALQVVVPAPTGEATIIVGDRWPHRSRAQPTTPAAAVLSGARELSGRMRPVLLGAQVTRWSGQRGQRRGKS